MINFTAQSNYFFIIISFFLTMNKKVKLNFIAINISIIVHYHSFKTASAHICYNL